MLQDGPSHTGSNTYESCQLLPLYREMNHILLIFLDPMYNLFLQVVNLLVRDLVPDRRLHDVCKCAHVPVVFLLWEPIPLEQWEQCT